LQQLRDNTYYNRKNLTDYSRFRGAKVAAFLCSLYVRTQTISVSVTSNDGFAP
jgi:hypothetical protein